MTRGQVLIKLCFLSSFQLARNVGNSGFNEILEANLLSPSLKPSQHSHM